MLFTFENLSSAIREAHLYGAVSRRLEMWVGMDVCECGAPMHVGSCY